MTAPTSQNGQPGPAGAEARLIGGRYRLAEPIGHGAMGVVWRAVDELLDRDVAVKEVRLPPSLSEAERDNSYQRTLREARTAARLSHPAVATVYDVVEERGRPWIVMELVRGRSLDQVIAEDGALPPKRAAVVGRQLLDALAAAHAAGVLHRDVKPSNVLLCPDSRTVLTDFGIATAEGDPSLTLAGVVMGSPGFLAPERVRGSPATPASDLWSLGATLYAAVEGQGPYDRHGGVMMTMAAVATEDPSPPKAAGPLTGLIIALLSRDPAARPTAATAAQMLEAAGSAGRGGRASPQPAPSGTIRIAAPGAVDARAAGTLSASQAQTTGTLRATRTLGPPALPVVPPVSPVHAASPVPAWPAPADAVMGRHGSPMSMGRQPNLPAAPAYRGGPLAGPVASSVAGSVARHTVHAGHRRPPTPSRHHHRITTIVIIGVAIFAAAAVTAAQLHKAGSVASHGGSTLRGGGQAGGSAITGTRGAVSRPPGGSLPAGFVWYSQAAGAAGAGTAGFRVAVPAGWRASHQGTRTVIAEPGGSRFLDLDLTPHQSTGMVAEALWLQRQSIRNGTFPGYHRYYIRAVPYLGSMAADWAFGWYNRSSGQTDVLDRVFTAQGSAQRQSFAVYWSTPASQWQASRRELREVLATLRPVW